MATYDDAFLSQLFAMPSSQYGAQHMKDAMPLDRGWAYTSLIPQDVQAYQQQYGFNPGAAPRGGWDGEGNWTGFSPTAVSGDAYARQLLQVLDAYGVNSTEQLPAEVRAQLPNQGLYQGKGSMSFGKQLVDFVTSPPVLMALGAGYGMYAGGAGAGAGAAEGASAAGAAEGAAAGSSGSLGTGITATAAEGGLGAGLGSTTAGTTGITAGTTTGAIGGGALGGGIGTGAGSAATGAGAGAGALAPGYFASEAPAAAGGSAAVGAPAVGGESSLLPAGTSMTELAMKAAPGLMGAYASDRQSDAYSGLAGQYMAMGEPYRQRLSDLYTDPSSFLNSPEVQVPIQQGTNILARALSTGGNPIGSGNALQELQNYATQQMWNRLGQERDRLGGFGGLTQYQAAAPELAAMGIGQQGNMWQALGGAAADVFGNNQKKVNLNDLYVTY